MRSIPLLLSCLALGCGLHHQVATLNAPPRPMQAKAPAAVHVYTSGRPGHAYHEVFLLQTDERSARAGYDESMILDELRRRAGALGCDALILLESTSTFTPSGRRRSGLRATCAVYDDPSVASGSDAG